ncbi:MAG: hypothetical protein HRU69_07310 [Flammeovirgaceae bacterium]|nr:MAG: hypothetical protein HRU69_07310 [Flammeovirgaceae bacterium]
MKTIIFFILSICSFIANSQSNEIHVIIFIDEQLITNNYYNVEFFVNKKDGTYDTIKVEYLPGRIILPNQSDYLKILSVENESLIFSFNYSTNNIRNEREVHEYTIKFEPGWIRQDYIILWLYNLSTRKYRRLFSSDSDYVFEVETPEYQMKRIRKK